MNYLNFDSFLDINSFSINENVLREILVNFLDSEFDESVLDKLKKPLRNLKSRYNKVKKSVFKNKKQLDNFATSNNVDGLTKGKVSDLRNTKIKADWSLRKKLRLEKYQKLLKKFKNPKVPGKGLTKGKLIGTGIILATAALLYKLGSKKDDFEYQYKIENDPKKKSFLRSKIDELNKKEYDAKKKLAGLKGGSSVTESYEVVDPITQQNVDMLINEWKELIEDAGFLELKKTYPHFYKFLCNLYDNEMELVDEFYTKKYIYDNADDFSKTEDLCKDIEYTQEVGMPFPDEPEYKEIKDHKNFDSFKKLLSELDDELEF